MFSQAAMMYRQAGKPERFLEPIEDYWEDTAVRHIKASAIQDSAPKLYPNAGPATWNRQVIAPTQAIINYAAKREKCSPIKVERFKVEKRAKEPATLDWVETFRANANPHLGALALFMFLTGARISEALAVTWDDIDLQRGKVLIRQTKIGDERFANLPIELVTAIANIVDRKATVFKYSSRSTAKIQWNKAVKRAGIKRLSFHACRHGFATALLHQGVDPLTVAKHGGWRSPKHVFDTYGHAMDDPKVNERILDAFRELNKRKANA